jgi:hypothetical protein
MTQTEIPPQAAAPVIPPSRLRSAAFFGLVYGAIQGAVPVIGELELSVVLHFGLLVGFIVTVAPQRGRDALTATVCYFAVLTLACLLPFKYLDSRVELGASELALGTLPARLQDAGYPVLVRAELPQKPIRLASSRPTLRELDHALRQQASLRLGPAPVCGNAVGLSFLWGPRTLGRRLFLIRQ